MRMLQVPPASEYPPDFNPAPTPPPEPPLCFDGTLVTTSTGVVCQPHPLAESGIDGDALGVVGLIAAVVIVAGVGAYAERFRKGR